VVVALHPTDAFEARLAARIVAMDAHAADSLRLAGLYPNDPWELHRCRRQAASMARQSDAALRSLLRLQATHEKQEATKHPAAMERAGYWFKDVSVPPPAPAAPPPPATEPEPAPAGSDAEADFYAKIYPDRAAGNAPAAVMAGPDPAIGPPEPDIVAALLRTTEVSSHATLAHQTTQ
jgi:hypothetical protein